LLFGLHTNIYI
jgi:hypothetical protein